MKEVQVDQFASNALWKFFEIIINKIISLVISTILARLLMPNAYGVIALTTVFITFSDIFLLNGFNVALVRKEEISEIDYSTVMFLSLIFSAVIYFFFYMIAPYMASFYKAPELKNVLRDIAVLIFFKSIASVIRAKGTRELKFKQMSVVSIVTTVCASIFGFIFAYKGFGVWALVWQQVILNFMDMLMMIIVFKWRFSFKFSIKVAREMTKFTSGVLGVSFLDFFGNSSSSLVIGKAYSTIDLGYYNRGNAYPETIGLNVYNSINSVLLPTLASRQNDDASLKRVVSKVISLTCYIIFPIMAGFIGISDKFVSVILTDKWNPCIPIIICACFNYSINPIRSIGYNVFYAKGESAKCIKIEVFRTIVLVFNLVFVISVLKKSIYYLAVMSIFVSLIVALITIVFVSRSIKYKITNLLQDISPAAIMSGVMMLIIRLVTLLPVNDVFILVFQIISGIIIYVMLSFITKNSNYVFLKEYAKNKISQKKRAF